MDISLNRFTKVKLISPDSLTIYETSVTPGLGIAAGSMSLEEIICDNELEFGAYNANKFEVTLFGLTHDVSGYTIQVYDEYTSGTKTWLFVGRVDSSKTDNYNEYRDIIAYDMMYFVRDLDVAQWWESYWSLHDTSTIRSLRETLIGFAGFSPVLSPLPNDNLYVTKFTSFTSVKFSVILRMLCQVQCCFPNINRQGEMEFITLGTTAVSLGTDYETGSCEFEDFTTAPITGINVFSTSNELTQTYEGTTSTPENKYPISGNIFLLSLNSTALASALQTMYNSIASISYVPATIPLIVSSYSYKLGTKVQTDRGYHYIFSQTLSGSMFVEQTIQSPAYGELLNNQASSANDEIIQGAKYSKLEQNIDGISADVYDDETGLAALNLRADQLTLAFEDVDGRTIQIQATIDGLTVTTPGGQTLIDGGKIQTDNLLLNRLYPYNGSANNYVEMQDAGLSFMLGQAGFIYLGYAQPSAQSQVKLPYLKLGLDTDSTSNIGAAIVKRYRNGIWIGNDIDLSSETIGPGSTGLYIDMVANVVYKYVNGQGYELADSQTVVATFG